jgi:hypothetical protein
MELPAIRATFKPAFPHPTEKKKASVLRAFLIGVTGFEPATF